MTTSALRLRAAEMDAIGRATARAMDPGLSVSFPLRVQIPGDRGRVLYSLNFKSRAQLVKARDALWLKCIQDDIAIYTTPGGGVHELIDRKAQMALFAPWNAGGPWGSAAATTVRRGLGAPWQLAKSLFGKKSS